VFADIVEESEKCGSSVTFTAVGEGGDHELNFAGYYVVFVGEFI
jgi:hypothetical protein